MANSNNSLSLSTSGKTHPNPEKFEEIGGSRVPFGKGVPQEAAKDSTLLYNEYIIYDTAQCAAKYLFRNGFISQVIITDSKSH